MICPKCGTENSDNSKFCSECAAPLVAVVETVIEKSLNNGTQLDELKAALNGKYEIIREIGRGGMGIVYECRELSLDRIVALKVLPRELTYDKQFVERFKSEMQIMAKLEHPNIVPFYTADEVNGFFYFTMKYIKGRSLSDLIKEHGMLGSNEARNISIQISEALAYAHDLNILHRDLKSDNILIDEYEHVYVADFGIARVLDGTRMTLTGAVIGTPEYMSPEQCHGDTQIDNRSDIYSLGIIMYEMLTGSVPFKGEPTAVMYQHVNINPPPLTMIIDACLAKKPEQRPQKASEIFHMNTYLSETKSVFNEKINKNTRKNSGWNWILWWRVGEDELKKQVDQYNTLKITQSARGISLLFLMLSFGLTCLFIIFSTQEYLNIIAIVVFLILGFFIYRGHRWAMISVMILWTIEKAYSFLSSPLPSIIFWCLYMHEFYLAYKVETIRKRNLKSR